MLSAMRLFINRFTTAVFISIISLSILSAQTSSTIRVNGQNIILEFNKNLYSRVISCINGKEKVLGGFTPSEYIVVNGKEISKFTFNKLKHSDIKDSIGEGKKYEIISSSGNLQKVITIKSYNKFPAMLFMSVSYTNTSHASIKVDSWTNNSYKFNALNPKGHQPLFWAYLPGSYGWDNNWLQPLRVGFKRDNYLGMNWVDYGGGTPVLDIWRKDVGLAIGHVELVPSDVSFPVSMKTKNYVDMSMSSRHAFTLKHGGTFTTLETFIAVHKGDCFTTLREYSKFMAAQGIKFKNAPDDAYQPIWCGWGYEQNFTIKEILNTLPEIKKLGLKWVVLDFGWDTGLGDNTPNRNKFPEGDTSMRAIVDSIHSIGAKAKLWWNPLAVYPSTKLFKDHPDYLLLNKDGSPRYIQYWNSFLLCPAYPPVQKYARNFVEKALKVWGFDGLKIDGNNLNTVPPCYNPAHHHSNPGESYKELPHFFKMIYETALKINPDAVVEICPCGTNQSFYILPYMNQNVASDPQNSWQIRMKGDVLRALTDNYTPYYGDHVELSTGGEDFASTVGVGGVPGTKFVYPPGVHMNTESGDVSMTPAKEKIWTKWIRIYNENMLSKGIYRGELYDIGFDIPETHAIQKGDTMYYAFYDSSFSGDVVFKGLQKKTYKIIDYVNNIALGKVQGPVAKLNVEFKKYLLVKAVPVSTNNLIN